MTNQAPKDAVALFFEGTDCMAAGDVSHAEACFRLALEIAPDFAEVHANLGLLLDKEGAQEAAEVCYRRAIDLNPELAQTYLNLGVLMASQKRFAEAEAAYKQAITCDPESPVSWSNLGVLLASMRREDEAEECYRTAMALDETYAMARFNLSYLLLRQGRFEEGWQCLEARRWYAALAAYLQVPRWHGEALAGKSIVIGYEAGHGDMIQFCRYADSLKRLGAASITLLCHPALKTLFATLDGVDRVIAFNEPTPASGWDVWTPLLSLPYFCQTRIDSIPANIPYLRASPECIQRWTAQLPEGGIRVGLVWKGNPLFENDADRSLPSLAVLAPLWAVAGVRFISLQKGAGEDEVAPVADGLSLIQLGAQFEDFADTAAALMSLDLLISVDTATAHLAGALGKPCWVMLPAYQTDWRWLTDRTDSPWYPGTLRLFRQNTMGDWSGVVAEMVAALGEFARRMA